MTDFAEAARAFRAAVSEAAQPVAITAAASPRRSASEDVAEWCRQERSRRGLPEPASRSRPDWSAVDAAEAERWTISRLHARAVAASGLPREAISASSLPAVDPSVDEVVQIDGGAMLVRRGDVVTAYPGVFE